MKRFAYVTVVVAVIFGWILSLPGWAQTEKPYPTRQITYIVCFDAGGQSDRLARMQQPLLVKILKQKVAIENAAGGGGALGWRRLVRARPDGYTMAGFNLPHVILQPLRQNVGYKTEQIVPLAIFQRTPLGLAVLKKSPYKTYQEFVEAAHKNPDQLTIGGSGSFTGYHMATHRLEKLAGVKLGYVPFTGSASQMREFLWGRMDAIFGASDDLTMHRDKIRVLAFATEERFAEFPDVPTFRELKVDLVEAVDRGAAVPLKTPQHIIRKLEAAFLEVATAPEIQAQLKKQGSIPVAIGHEESVAYIKHMTAAYKELISGLAK